MLPTTSATSQGPGDGAFRSRDAARHTAGAKRSKYLRRLFRFRQMDFEFAAWQMLYLFTSPQRVYRNFHYRKQTKDQWARDDPAFLVLLSVWLCVSTVGFGFVLDMGFWETTKLLLWVVFIDCIGVGLLISTLMCRAGTATWSGATPSTSTSTRSTPCSSSCTSSSSSSSTTSSRRARSSAVSWGTPCGWSPSGITSTSPSSGTAPCPA
ncbi:protein unc-50 homolog isoform X3 [Ornithorhynchus anatinus]|uniref:protein unc-50 homolog isoform X3 n=1 Tax=Ornithorhynchus anatinus TaxID=9258 RepID=UPI0010A8D790|nr:protein unc-50 homolog isoform X3 [Ornithorhynchus anatinus]